MSRVEIADEAAAPSQRMSECENRALARVRRNLLPFLFVLYIVAYLDRINVGFASLQMNRDLGLGDAVFGLGAGLFFVGYFVFEVPSNLILARVGARMWIARILISWGIVAIAMMFVRGPHSFYTLRFMLGAAEAGFFPGVILYLTYWFPAREQARAVALFMTAAAVAGIVAGPVSGALLTMNGIGGLAGWQWMFLAEGIPAIAMGALVMRQLPDRPAEARWLPADEREALDAMLADDRAASTGARAYRMADALGNSRVWILSAIYFGVVVGLYGVGFWLPQIVQGFHVRGDFVIGLITMVPYGVATVAMVAVARMADRSGDRRRALAISLTAGAAGLLLSALAHNPILELAALSLAAAGIFSAFGPFWTFPPEFLGGTAAAGGVALINSIGNLGGFCGPYAMGLMRQATHGFAGGLAVLAGALALSGVLAITMTPSARR